MPLVRRQPPLHTKNRRLENGRRDRAQPYLNVSPAIRSFATGTRLRPHPAKQIIASLWPYRLLITNYFQNADEKTSLKVRYKMHVMILGAAGMVGRKLTQQLTRVGHLGRKKKLTALSLVDTIEPEERNPPIFPGMYPLQSQNLSIPGAAIKCAATRPDVCFSFGGRGLRRGRGRL